MYSNADQLLNKMEELKAQIAEKAPDIMLFTEVIPKAQKNPIHETQVEIDGYQLFKNFNYTDTNLGASGIRGVAIYVKEGISCEEIKLQSTLSDQVWVKISLKNNDKLLCGCVYRSPTNDSDSTRASTTQVCTVIKEAAELDLSHLLIVGDFNYPRIDWDTEDVNENSPIIKPFLEEIQGNFLHQHVTQPTRYREDQEPSLLDLILTNEEGMINEMTHNPPLGDSDHECLNFRIECYHAKSQSSVDQRRNYFKADYETIIKRLEEIDWNQVLQGDFQTCYEKFITILEQCLEGCVPMFKAGKKKKNIYLTTKAIRLKDLKNKLWRRYKKSKCEYDRNRYVQTKNQLRTLTRNLRAQFEALIAGDIKTAPKKFWSYVKSRAKTRSKIPTLKKSNGTCATEAKDKAETLNNFFINNFTEERLDDLPPIHEDDIPECRLDSFTISPEVVLEKLLVLKLDKTPGQDG